MIFAPMQLNLTDRATGRAMSVTVPLSEVRDWVWPYTGAKRGRIRPREMLRELEAASKQLDNFTINCLVDHGDGHIEYVRNLHLVRLGTLTEKWSRNGRNLQYEDSEIELILTSPPGRVDTGPAVPTSLTYWGARNIRAWRMSLNLAYFNYDPGVTGARINKGRWIDFRHPDFYPVVDDRKLLELVDPRNAGKSHGEHLQRAKRTLALQEGRGDVKVVHGTDGERRIIQTTPRDRHENGEET